MAKKTKIRPDRINFRAGARIGFADAEDDGDFLRHCYVDMGYVTQALDTEDPGSILLGRTGSGKTATILHIETVEENVIRLNAEDLSLNFISNSTILSFFHSLGVDLDLFFQLLWRHVLCIEILSYHYGKKQKASVSNILGILKEFVGSNQSKRKALDYLSKWESTFWEESQKRIEEIVDNFEQQLKAGVDLSNLGIPINAQACSKISSERKAEIAHEARKVVNGVQIRELSAVMDVIADDILVNKQEHYYVVIDRLDENWVDDSLRYRLVRALIETIKAFRKIRNVKLIIAIRADLLERVYKYTRGSGFQEEKYEDFNIPISWSEEQLFDMVDRRIRELFKRQYTKDRVGFYDIFPERYRQQSKCFDYIVQRTQFRPRDVIAFINQILITVSGKTEIGARDIDSAEIEYSKRRLLALCSEWQDEHPCLDIVVQILYGKPIRMKVPDLGDEMLRGIVSKLIEKPESADGITELASEVYLEEVDVDQLRRRIVAIMYKVGIIGIKRNGYDQTQFSYSSSYVVRDEDINGEVEIAVSPMLWQALGSKKRKSRGEGMREGLGLGASE